MSSDVITTYPAGDYDIYQTNSTNTIWPWNYPNWYYVTNPNPHPEKCPECGYCKCCGRSNGKKEGKKK